MRNVENGEPAVDTTKNSDLIPTMESPQGNNLLRPKEASRALQALSLEIMKLLIDQAGISDS